MKKMCYLLTMGLLAGSLTVPVFAASDADSASDKKWVIATDTVFKPFEYTDDDGNVCKIVNSMKENIVPEGNIKGVT